MELAAALPDLIMIMLYGGISSCSLQWSDHCPFCYLWGFLSASKRLTGLHGILIFQKGLKVLKERGSCSFSPLLSPSIFPPPLWKVMEPLPSSLSTARHCGPHFPKDYCHWSLPFGQSWHHSHCAWLQWLAGQRGGNRHSLSNPHSHIWEFSGSSHHPSLLSLLLTFFYFCLFSLPCRSAAQQVHSPACPSPS